MVCILSYMVQAALGLPPQVSSATTCTVFLFLILCSHKVAEDQEAPVTPKEMVFEAIKSNYIPRTKKQGSIIKSHPLTIDKMFTVKLMERNLPANNRNQNIFL